MSAFVHIAIVGSGNVARYFLQGMNRPQWRLSSFARKATGDFRPMEELLETPDDFDLILLCVSDDAIGEVSQKLPAGNAIVAHVSGGTDLNVIDARHHHRAVFYPLMSIKPGSELPIAQIPFCLEAEDEKDLRLLEGLTEALGAKSYRVNSAQRKHLHLAAVFSQNFTNHLYHKAREILKGQDLDFKMLLPLLENSLQKLHTQKPEELQTGPAVRNDKGTMQKHLKLLQTSVDKDIYKLLSKSIQNTHDQKL